jgi:hypothetical protein
MPDYLGTRSYFSHSHKLGFVISVFVAILLIPICQHDIQAQGCADCPLPTFQSPRIVVDTSNLPTPNDVASIVSGDFNNDGKLDLAWSYGGGYVPGGIAVMLGDGTGNFGLPIYTESSPSGPLMDAMTGDFNSDGNLDIAALRYTAVEAALIVFLGDGTGHFSVTAYYTADPSSGWGLAVGDLNNDNKLDIVVFVGQARDVSFIHLGDGLGGFLRPSTLGFLSTPEFGSGGGVIADFNRDGNADLAACGLGNPSPCDLFYGDGAGNFSEGTYLGVGGDGPGWGYGPGSLATADLNGDGNLDLVSSNFKVAFGSGNGGFSNVVHYGGGVGNCWGTGDFGPSIQPCRERDRPGIRVVDINGDGKLDLVSALSIRLGDGSGNFATLVNLPFENLGDYYGPSDVTVGDFNGDGKPDILRLQAWHVSLFINLTFQTAVGTNSTVVVDNTTLTFDEVTAGGTTTVTPIDPATAGQVPGGFAVSNSVAYEIATTASFTGSVTLAFKVPGPISQEDFNSLAILHNVNGTLVDVTTSTPPRDYANLTIYATTTSLSPFYLARRGPHIKTLFDQTRAYKSGSTIPIKLQVFNASNSNISSSNTSLVTRDLRLMSGNTIAPVLDSGNANPDYIFRYDPTLGGTGGGYIFNLSTKGLASGQYVLSFYVGSDRSFFYTVKFEVK